MPVRGIGMGFSTASTTSDISIFRVLNRTVMSYTNCAT